MRDTLIFSSHTLLALSIVVGLARFSSLPLMARLLFISLPCGLAAEAIGHLRSVIRLNPEIIFSVYGLIEGVVFIAGAAVLLRRRRSRAVLWLGVAALATAIFYQHVYLRREGFNTAVYLTQCVVMVTVYLLVLAEAALAGDSSSMPAGVLLLCIAVLVYSSLAPLSFPAVDYFYYNGKQKLSEQVSLINTVSCILRYGLTLSAFLVMRRKPPQVSYER